LGADFEVYRVYRDGVLIGEVQDESDTAFDDWEALRGVEESYEVSVVSTFGVESPVSDPAPVTVPVPARKAWCITSNHDPTVNVSLCVSEPAYELPLDRTVLTPYGRDNRLVADGTEDRGDTITLPFKVKTGAAFIPTALTTMDRILLDDLDAAQKADVPHLTVLSPFGRRWYSAIAVEQARVPHGAVVDGEVLVIEVQDDPTVLVVPPAGS